MRRKLKINNLLYVLCLLMVITGCQRVKPQAPANKTTNDSIREKAALLNMQLSNEAKNECLQYVLKQPDKQNYVESEYGFWYCVTHRSANPKLQTDEEVMVSYDTYLMNDIFVEENTVTCKVGHRDVFMALDMLFPYLADGDKVTIVTPYYLAYGREGTDKVPPYTNCIIRVNNIQRVNNN